MRCTSCIWPAGSDRNCFCHLSPEEFSSFSKKFAQLLPATASDNQFINISNPDPFTLLKLISTKYVFPKSCSQIPIPIQFFCQPNLIESEALKFNRSFHLEKKRTKSDLKLFKAQLIMMKLNEWEFSAFEIQIFCLTGRSLSYLYWKIQNPTPRRKIEFLTDCCFNFQFNLGANEYINSNVHRARERKRVVRSEAHCRKVFRIPICLNRLLSHLHLDYNDMAEIFVPDMEDNERSGSR